MKIGISQTRKLVRPNQKHVSTNPEGFGGKTRWKSEIDGGKIAAVKKEESNGVGPRRKDSLVRPILTRSI